MTTHRSNNWLRIVILIAMAALIVALLFACARSARASSPQLLIPPLCDARGHLYYTHSWFGYRWQIQHGATRPVGGRCASRITN